MTRDDYRKPLKDQNHWQLWLTIAVNSALLYVVAQTNTLEANGVAALVASPANLLPVGLAWIVTTVANGLLSATMKARLVFLRWNHALPGHRAFSKYATSDPRIDFGQLKRKLRNKLPIGPEDENRIWYRLYREVESEPAVIHVHRQFLFSRDYSALAFLFLLGFGGTAVFLVDSTNVLFVYFGLLMLQFFIVRHAAATYGVQFVATVLAHVAAKPKPVMSKATQ